MSDIDTKTGNGHASIVDVDGVIAVRGSNIHTQSEQVAREEPLEIRVAGFQLAVTMRTPGADFDLVSGFLITEGILASLDQVDSLIYCPDENNVDPSNIVNVQLHDPSSLDPSRFQRNFFASSSCGVCGKASIQSVRTDAKPLPRTDKLDISSLHVLRTALADNQPIFRQTGGLHAAVIAGFEGNLLATREDVGRHNAVDKVVGAMSRAGSIPTNSILLVSGRVSFEITQKALMAGIPVVAAVSAPSSLAVGLAREVDLTLVGFLRDGRCNVYAGADRIRM